MHSHVSFESVHVIVFITTINTFILDTWKFAFFAVRYRFLLGINCFFFVEDFKESFFGFFIWFQCLSLALCRLFTTLSMERILIVASAFPVGEKKTAPILSVELG